MSLSITRSLYQSLFTCVLSSCSLLAVNGQSVVFAQITPDHTTATEIKGNAIAPVGAGTVNGGNLYHSFDQFNVPNTGVVFNTGSSTVDGTKINNILNRVTGDNPSQILGTIESRTAFPNANVFLLNPNGVVFGKDARLDIGGSFNVSTGTSLGFSGDRTFSANKNSLDFPSGDPQNIKFGISQPAAIINQGNLTVGAGKSIAFTAGSVVNSGVLTAPSGNVALTSVSGGSVVDLRSPDLVLGLSVIKDAVPTNWNGEIATLPKLAELLTGKAEQGDRVVVKPDGTLAIVVTPASNEVPVTNGTTVVSGSVNTSFANSNGGNVGIFGDRVAVVNSQIIATGINGGKVLIGGDLQGKGTVPNAEFTYFDRKSVVDVSALENGDGGLAIVWGDLSTRFLGSIVANAGNVSGDGGFVEVSGKANLDYRGIVSTLAPNGNLGTLLLDPTDITLVATGGFFAALTAVDNFADPNGTVNTLNVGLINNALSNVVLQATNNINIDQPINITGLGIGFTAQSGNNINVNQNITTNRGAISLLANNGTTASTLGSIQSTGSNISLITNGGNFTATGVNFGNITTIDTSSSTGGGNIDINVTGAINANPSTLLSGISGTGTGNAGNISLKALGNIQANALQAADEVGATVINGGNVTLDAGGSITIGTLGSIATRSTSGGKAGDVLLKSGGSITALGTTGINTSVIGTSVGGSQAGNVTFQAGTAINTNAAIATSINSNTVTGNAGNITFTAVGNISATGDLITTNLGTGNAGKVDITSDTNSITAGNIVAGSSATASDVTLKASTNITTGYILGIGGIQGSNVSLTATNGSITIPSTAVIPSTLFGVNLTPCIASNICTAARNGIGGNITIAGNLSLTNPTKFLSTGTPTGGAINLSNANINGTQNLNLDSGTGAITLGNIGATTKLGTLTINAGSILANQAIAAKNISFTTTDNITTQLLNTSDSVSGSAGNVNIQSNNGNITIASIITSPFITGNNAGNVTIQAKGDISLSPPSGKAAIDAFVGVGNTGNGGIVLITSSNGKVTTGAINTAADFGNAGNVTVQSFGDIKTTGNFTLGTNVFAIDAFSTSSGNGGNVSLTSSNGAIDVSSGRVVNSSFSGTAGSIALNAFGNITTGAGTTPNPAVASFVSTLGTGTPNSITFTSSNGTINTSLGDIDAGGGIITFTAKNNITTSGVFSRAVNGGSIKLESQLGAIDSTAGDLTTTTTSTGTGGSITLLANNNITTKGVFATGANGKIDITSTNGGINTSLNDLSSFGSNTSLTLKALQNIVTRNVFAPGDGSTISITSTSGNVDTSLGFIQGGIDASQTGSGGTLTIKSAGNISAGAINVPNLSSSVGNAGSVFLTSDTGTISFTAISARRANGNGNGGTINLQANGNITSTGVVSIAGIPSIYSLITGVFGANGNGGSISLTSTNGSIDTRSGTTGTFAASGNGGAISLTSQTGAIATGDLSANGSNNGGNITVDANTKINVGRVNSRGSFGNGGNVILDPIGDVIFTAIDATGGGTSGNGGNIKIVSTSGNVLGTGVSLSTFGTCVGSTICTNGTGTVSIQHGITSPFNLNSFLVGSADTNGTFGAIVAGGFPLSLTPIPNGAGFFTQGNISISPGRGLFIPPTTPTNTITVLPKSPINPIIIVSNPPVVVTTSQPPSVDISRITNQKAGEYLAAGKYEEAVNEMEKGHISEFENYLGETLTPQIKNLDQLQQELDEISLRTGSATTVVYPLILSDRLELLIIPPKGTGKPFREFVADAKESEITPIIQDFANNIRDINSQDYLEQSQKLYNWLVRPYSDRLEALQKNNQTNSPQANIKQNESKPNVTAEKLPPTLVFVMDGGLRVIPVAALHDGKQFLIEKYALANLPYLRASRLESRDRRLNSILAMGLTESVQGFAALPSVKLEVSTIGSKVLVGDTYLDKEFTVENLQAKRRQGNFTILHLATHAKFNSSDAQGAFIQFWNERLTIDRIPSLRFDSPLIEMLTLSACQTAVGQNLGLGGLAASSGARSVLASLWEVSDIGTAPLMIEFYNSFPENITKAIALQRAQVDLLRGTVSIKDGKIIGIPKLPAIPLSNKNVDNVNLEHPFFWSSFILIGNWL